MTKAVRALARPTSSLISSRINDLNISRTNSHKPPTEDLVLRTQPVERSNNRILIRMSLHHSFVIIVIITVVNTRKGGSGHCELTG